MIDRKDEDFVPNTLTIKELFNNDVKYKVPDYQRRYSWNDDQLFALWDDLYESYKNDVPAYFLGSVVVVYNKNNGYLEIIDGQQRLTTLMIMNCVLFKIFPNLECKDPVYPENDHLWINRKSLEKCIYSDDKFKLILQTAPEYNTAFRDTILSDEIDFSQFKKPTKKQMKSDDPTFNFVNTAKFFYNHFMDNKNFINEEDRNNFIHYIFTNVKVIRITCNSVSFAIKLFQVLNDRGLPLLSSDIVKSYILGRIDNEYNDDASLKDEFTNNWKKTEDMLKDYDLKMDDFIVYYEYYKLKKNPARQIVDELESVIKDKNTKIGDIILELYKFSEAIKKSYDEENTIIYSLRLLPWNAYINTCLASMYKVDYNEKDKLLKLMRRYFYLAFISGKTLNQIKQTSFNLIAAIVENKSIEYIEKIFNESIERYSMIKGTMEALDDDVYGENFLKPLLISIEYFVREDSNASNTIIKLNKDLHVDHVLPREFLKNDYWKSYINEESGNEYKNKLGNMALLCSTKNEQALNFGFDIKCKIYRGKDKDGNSINGVTCFNTTEEIASDYYESQEKEKWDIDLIIKRQNKQIERIKNMLELK